MRIPVLLAALAFSIGCSKKKAADTPPAPPPPVAADAAASPPPPAPPDAAAPAVDAAQAAPTPTPGGKAICCESTGDATHDSLELTAAVCTGDGLNGDVVKLEDCDVKGDVPIIPAGQAVTIAAPGQYVAWAGNEEDQLVACEIKVDAKQATVKCKGGGDEWKKTGKAPVAGAPITLTPNADGTAILANGTTSWKLAAEYRYGDVKMKEAAK